MLTLVEETLLLTFHDKTGRRLKLPEYSVEFAAAGAVLADLALADRIDTELLRLARVPSIHESALHRLVEQGVLRRQKRRLPFSLGAQKYEVADPTRPRSIKTRLREILTTDTIPDPRDVILVCLGNACSLLGTVLGPQDLKAAAPRIQQVSRMDLIGRGMLRELQKTHDVIRRVGWWGVTRIELASGATTEGS